jgi:molybdenum cofactor cytidylyltransferase
MISAIILAAGSSRRMGEPKTLLTINGKTFLQHIVDILHSARILDVVIVVGYDAEKIKSTFTWFSGTVVTNELWQDGQLSSLIKGIDALKHQDVLGAMVCPVDHPFLSQKLIVDLLQAYWKTKKKIIIPVYHGQRGHPVIFSKALFDEIRNAPHDVGARSVVQNHPDEICEVKTEEQGVVLNIDTPEDYRSAIERFAV